MQLSSSLASCQVNVKQRCSPTPVHPNPEPLLLSLSHFDLAEAGVRGNAKCCLKQGAYFIKNVMQVDEVQVMWLWHHVRQYSYVIQSVKVILRMDYTMYIDAYRKPEETL